LCASYGQVLAAQAEVRSMARFPQENPSPVLRAGAGGLLLAANPASAGLLAHLGVQVGQALPEKYAAVIAHALFSGEVQRFEAEFDGRALALVASPVSAEGFVNIYGMDITERKAAENALRKSEAILQAAMDQSQAGIAIADAPSGRLRYVNKAGLLIHGVDEAGAVNGVDVNQYVASWKMLDLDGRPLEMPEAPLARAVMFGETSAREFIIRRAEGDDRIVWANAAPILNEHGRVSAGIVVFMDITARKKAEEALRKSEETFRAMVESAPLAIFMSTGAEQTTTYVNPTFVKLFGYTIQDVPNVAAWWPLAYPEPEYRRQVLEQWTGRVARAIKARTAAEPLEVVCTCKDGSQKTVSWGFMSLDGLNYAYGLDLTERKRAEEEVRRNNARLQCLVRVLQHKAESVQEFLDYSLTEALKLTESRFGYIYHYSEERREFVLNSWSSEVMAECRVKGAPKVYELDKTGIWGEAVRQRRPLIVNDFQAANPHKRGYPEGHVELHNFMTVPVLHDGRIVAVAGVANKSGEYQEADMGQF
ncbi:MAG: PAS domain S-box protein, partial [Humidesulfovibrio sp.]|nr:PAS domain S-box protein [Humidesulfovibrio sp.]